MSRVVVYGFDTQWPVVLDGSASEIDPDDLIYVRMGPVLGVNPPYDELAYYNVSNGIYIVLKGEIVGDTFEAEQVTFQSEYTGQWWVTGDVYLTYYADPPLIIDPEGPGDLSLNAVLPLMGGNDDISGSPGDDIIYGYGGDDELTGHEGDDLLNGGDGNDRLLGYGSGSDIFIGGAGNDEIYVYPSLDTAESVVVEGGTGTDLLGFTAAVEVTFLSADSGIITTLGYEGTSGTFSGIEIIQGSTGGFFLGGRDVITGASGSNTFYGLDGNDDLSGGAGNDFLYGGDDNDDLAGNGGRDSLYGEDGRDDLDGGRGNDFLDGGAGDDILAGGEGADQFFFGSGVGDDLISDFATAEDTLLFAIDPQFAWVIRRFTEQVGDDVVIGVEGRSVTLEGVQLADMTLANFELV